LVTRSAVRRWALPAFEVVHHRHAGQEWVPHWHDEWSIGAILSGYCQCCVGGVPMRGRPGDLIAIAPGVVHTGALLAPDAPEGASVLMLYVAPAWLGDPANGIALPGGSGFLSAPGLAERAGCLATPASLAHWLREACAALASGLPNNSAQGGDPTAAARRLLSDFRDGVLSGIDEVGALAAHCGVSRERLHRVVRRWTALSPSHYLRALRVNRARLCLTDGADLASVAQACGFADQAHMTRVFRQTLGYSPGDYLRANPGACKI
jgi:AraC-like DNA-binding protein